MTKLIQRFAVFASFLMITACSQGPSDEADDGDVDVSGEDLEEQDADVGDEGVEPIADPVDEVSESTDFDIEEEDLIDLIDADEEPDAVIEGCGNGVVEDEEECDGEDFDWDSCLARGYLYGSLACTSGCLIEADACSLFPTCGNDLREGHEACDDGNIVPGDGCDASCAVEGCVEGDGAPLWWLDRDRDGYGDDDTDPVHACTVPIPEDPYHDYSARPGDCNDLVSSINPDAIDYCDEQDNNCDGVVDELCGRDCTGLDDGDPCMIPYGFGQCLGGTCEVGSCIDAYDDCNDSADDGCEAILHMDDDNCGTCGHACAVVPHGHYGCFNFLCVNLFCDYGWADCTAADGCETDIHTDANCGGCNNPCVRDHAVGTCDDYGHCMLASCDDGYYDIDGSPMNGCEYACTPAGDEVCADGVDNDCDGMIDQRPCYEGPADTRNVGACEDGVQSCEGSDWGPCTGQVLPQASDGCTASDYCWDYNCDGSRGVGCDCDHDGYAIPDDCDDDFNFIHPGAAEICNLLDDDCDDAIDEACVPTCTDRLRNGDETDIDCGGSCPYNCEDWQRCGTGEDCQSGECTYGRCGLCGNDAIDDGYPFYEQCDDGNHDFGDGCFACRVEMGWACTGEPSLCVPGHTDGDDDGHPISEDCDDANPDIFPGADEICDDGIDQNCDGFDVCNPDCTEIGSLCSIPLAIGVCHELRCTFVACVPGRAECNGDMTDGCEAYGRPTACCGVDCTVTGQVCSSGRCADSIYEDCDDSVDNDGDGAIDDADLECIYPGLVP